MPLFAAVCRSLERKLLIFLVLGFSCQAEGREFEPRFPLHLYETPLTDLVGGVFF